MVESFIFWKEVKPAVLNSIAQIFVLCGYLFWNLKNVYFVLFQVLKNVPIVAWTFFCYTF